jgi:hypothetical protein
MNESLEKCICPRQQIADKTGAKKITKKTRFMIEKEQKHQKVIDLTTKNSFWILIHFWFTFK